MTPNLKQACEGVRPCNCTSVICERTQNITRSLKLKYANLNEIGMRKNHLMLHFSQLYLVYKNEDLGHSNGSKKNNVDMAPKKRKKCLL